MAIGTDDLPDDPASARVPAGAAEFPLPLTGAGAGAGAGGKECRVGSADGAMVVDLWYYSM